MPEETSQKEPFDEYADQFLITITPFGANLTFALREAHPSAQRAQQTRQLGTIRMSVEHLKTMVMIIRRQVLKIEHESGIKAEVAIPVLNQLGIAPEDWDNFWKFV